MKKIGIILTFVFTLFVGISGVSAKTKNMNYVKDDSVGMVCQYSFDYNNEKYFVILNYDNNTMYYKKVDASFNSKSVLNVAYNSKPKTCSTQLFYDDSNFSISYVSKLYYDYNLKNPVFGDIYQCYISISKKEAKWTNEDLSNDNSWTKINDSNAKDQVTCNAILQSRLTSIDKNKNPKKCYIAGQLYKWTTENPGGYTLYENVESEQECINRMLQNDININPDITVNYGDTVSCGNGTIKNIPRRIVKIVNTVISVIQIAVPILLIILGMIDLGKSVLGQKEDEIKKGQKVFISRLITGILVFFVIFVVKIAVRFVNEASDSSKIISCVDCFIQGNCE